MTHTRSAMRLGLALFVAALACKQDSGIDSGLPGDKLGSALGDSEKTQLCAAGDEYLAAQFSEEKDKLHACIGLGRAGSSCDEVVAECLADNKSPLARSACSLPLAWSTCDVPVSEIEACWVERFDELREYLEEFSCSSPPLVHEYSESCEHVHARCPQYDE